MMQALRSISVASHHREEMIDITSEVQAAVAEAGIKEGLVVAQVMHTTAGITINENADPDVTHDMINYLNRLVPQDSRFRHSEGNSDAHIKSSLVGVTLTIPISQSRLLLGTWQGIYFCEFDGPRQRKVMLMLME